MNGYEVYCLYTALKLHFSTDYDFFKYNGKVKSTTPEAFERRRDKYMFHKLARKLKDHEVMPFLISNFLIKNKSWSKQLLEPTSFEIFQRFQKTHMSFKYTFLTDLRYIRDNCGLSKSLQLQEDRYPEAFVFLMQGGITIETVCALHALTGCLNVWDAKHKDDYIYSRISFSLRKYLPFLGLDPTKLNELKEISKTVLTE